MNLKELREKNKLTQTALAKSIGVSSNAVSAIESGRLKLSEKLSGRIKEVYGEVIEPEAKKARTAKKRAEKKVKAAEAAIETAGAAAVLDAGQKLEKKTRKRRARAQAAKPAVEAGAEAVAEAAAAIEEKVERKAGRARKAKLVIQSPMGGEITPDAILAKIGGADTVYVRVDQNKAYWVRGEETGSVDLW